ncbi:hypothetical protein EON67_06985 [archaeon]|nr:MAG: hypothetical protein EON67_06985 [archaeon]
MCASPTNNVLACPGMTKGSVRVDLYDRGKTTFISAHEAALACIALNQTGTRLATASEKGTLIRCVHAGAAPRRTCPSHAHRCA